MIDLVLYAVNSKEIFQPSSYSRVYKMILNLSYTQKSKWQVQLVMEN